MYGTTGTPLFLRSSSGSRRSSLKNGNSTFTDALSCSEAYARTRTCTHTHSHTHTHALAHAHARTHATSHSLTHSSSACHRNDLFLFRASSFLRFPAIWNVHACVKKYWKLRVSQKWNLQQKESEDAWKTTTTTTTMTTTTTKTTTPEKYLGWSRFIFKFFFTHVDFRFFNRLGSCWRWEQKDWQDGIFLSFGFNGAYVSCSGTQTGLKLLMESFL